MVCLLAIKIKSCGFHLTLDYTDVRSCAVGQLANLAFNPTRQLPIHAAQVSAIDSFSISTHLQRDQPLNHPCFHRRRYRVPFTSSMGVLWTLYLSLLNQVRGGSTADPDKSEAVLAGA